MNSELDDQQRVTIGKILKPRGIRGELKVLSLSDIPDRFEMLAAAYIQTPTGQSVRVEIEGVRYYKEFVYLCLQGYESIEAVQPLVGGMLQVDAADSPELPEGVYYHFEIIGAAVYTDDARYLGRVTEILETGSYDVYVVRGENREYMIPAQPDVVTSIDRQQKKITIHPLDGLLDL